MPNNIGETSLVLADSVFPNRTVVTIGASILVIGCIVHRIWPRHLAYILVVSMRETEKLYYDAVEAGELPRDVGTEEKLLRFFRGHSITLLQCADEIQSFETHIEVTQLQTNLNSTNPGLATSVRRKLYGPVFVKPTP
ncbi:hypothetical protein C8J57DRAFT_1237930 [Mycena rebaudengoi]|nr:hypothetical protein C8J57DRAFT_1237930 [Mycena rebaudengoi]